MLIDQSSNKSPPLFAFPLTGPMARPQLVSWRFPFSDFRQPIALAIISGKCKRRGTSGTIQQGRLNERRIDSRSWVSLYRLQPSHTGRPLLTDWRHTVPLPSPTQQMSSLSAAVSPEPVSQGRYLNTTNPSKLSWSKHEHFVVVQQEGMEVTSNQVFPHPGRVDDSLLSPLASSRWKVWNWGSNHHVAIWKLSSLGPC